MYIAYEISVYLFGVHDVERVENLIFPDIRRHASRTGQADKAGEKHCNKAYIAGDRKEARGRETILINIYLIKSLPVEGIVAAPRGRYLCHAVRG